MNAKLVTSLMLALALAAAQVAEAAQTRVLFISNPSGALVVDENLGELGRTPFRMNIKRKTELNCTFSKKGFETRTVAQTVDGLKLDVRADLPALPLTTVRLGVEPRQTSVRLTSADGTEIYSGEGGRVHTLPNDFWTTEETAKFMVEAWAPGYRPVEEEIELKQHQYHELEFPLGEITTLLTVTADPEEVRVQDQFLGELGWTPLEVRISLVDIMRARSRRGASTGDPAHLLLTLSRDGYSTRALQVALDFERAENTVSETLEPSADASGN